jgi:2,2-dialkylglycine decarboxylase (pyruvate)
LLIVVTAITGLDGISRIAPPLTATREELSLGLDILDRALTETA